jgi:hypothetical protein
MKRREFLQSTGAVAAVPLLGISSRGIGEPKSDIPDPIPKDPAKLEDLCERINKMHDRACNALKVVGRFSDEEVQKVRKWICKYQDRMKFLKRTYPWDGREHRMSPREIFLMPDIPSVIPLGVNMVPGGREDRIRIWDAICISLRTIHDGFDLLAIDTWWEDEA